MAPNPPKRRLAASEGVAAGGSSHRPNKRPTTRPPHSPLLKASIISLAEERPMGTNDSLLDNSIRDRIKKCLERANHKSSTESEARAALFLSRKLMAQYNVTYADIIAEESPTDQAQYAGCSVVSIARTGEGSASVQNEGFVGGAAKAMDIFFDCQHYSSRGRRSIQWNFYGIAENTVAAARAFEMVYNLVSQWALAYKDKSAKFSYTTGVSAGLIRLATREKAQEEEAAQNTEREEREERMREEERQRMEEQARLNFQSESLLSDDEMPLESGIPSPTSLDQPGTGEGDSDDEETKTGITFPTDFEENGDIIDLTVDLEEEIQKLAKREQSPTLSAIKSEEGEPVISAKREHSPAGADTLEPAAEPVTSLWKSQGQLVRFRETAKKVADDFLEQQDKKLYKGRPNRTPIRDRSAHRQGRIDSEKVDVRGRRLE